MPVGYYFEVITKGLRRHAELLRPDPAGRPVADHRLHPGPATEPARDAASCPTSVNERSTREGSSEYRPRRHTRRRPPRGPPSPDRRTGPTYTRFAGHRGHRRPRALPRRRLRRTSAGARRRRSRKPPRSGSRSAYLTGFTYWFSLPLGGDGAPDDRLPREDVVGPAAPPAAGGRDPHAAAVRSLLFVPLVVVAGIEHYSPYWWTHPDEAHARRTATVRRCRDGAADKREQAIEAGEVHDRQGGRARARSRAEGQLRLPLDAGVHRRRPRAVRDLGHDDLLPQQVGEGCIGRDRQREGGSACTKLEQALRAGLIIYAITITAAATQWVMSLEPGWASTMFPVIFAVNQFLTCFAFCLALFLLFASRPPFKDVMRPKFQLDMGTLLLAFTLFWSYTSFSPVHAGVDREPAGRDPVLPEAVGPTAGWWCVSAALIAFHFALPFLLLLFRDIKLHPVRLRVVAVYLLVDLRDRRDRGGSQPTHAALRRASRIWLMDVGAIVGHRRRVGAVLRLAVEAAAAVAGQPGLPVCRRGTTMSTTNPEHGRAAARTRSAVSRRLHPVRRRGRPRRQRPAGRRDDRARPRSRRLRRRKRHQRAVARGHVLRARVRHDVGHLLLHRANGRGPDRAPAGRRTEQQDRSTSGSPASAAASEVDQPRLEDCSSSARATPARSRSRNCRTGNSPWIHPEDLRANRTNTPAAVPAGWVDPSKTRGTRIPIDDAMEHGRAEGCKVSRPPRLSVAARLADTCRPPPTPAAARCVEGVPPKLRGRGRRRRRASEGEGKKGKK